MPDRDQATALCGGRPCRKLLKADIRASGLARLPWLLRSAEAGDLNVERKVGCKVMGREAVEIITGRERRRRWSMADKLRILAECDEPGVRVSEVAARHSLVDGLRGAPSEDGQTAGPAAATRSALRHLVCPKCRKPRTASGNRQVWGACKAWGAWIRPLYTLPSEA